MITITQT